jgi:exosortase/archaeosortase
LINLGIYGLFALNATSHIGTFLVSGEYNAGVLTAFLVQVPFSLWVAYAMAGDRRVRASGIAVLIGAGIGVHVVLLGSLVAFAHGLISGGTLVVLQLLNPAWCFALPWLKERSDARRITPRA